MILPTHDIPEPAGVRRQLSMSQWAAVTSSLTGDNGFVYFQASLEEPKASTASYLREVATALRQANTMASFAICELYNTILSGEPVVRLFVLASESKRLQDALITESVGTLEPFPGTL